MTDSPHVRWVYQPESDRFLESWTLVIDGIDYASVWVGCAEGYLAAVNAKPAAFDQQVDLTAQQGEDEESAFDTLEEAQAWLISKVKPLQGWDLIEALLP